MVFNGVFLPLENTNKMKKKPEVEEHDLEILKAVAQAWHGRSGNTRQHKNEFDAKQNSFKTRPTRFKLEAINKKMSKEAANNGASSWDFGQSLLDSYELVTLSKRLEAGLVLDQEILPGIEDDSSRKYKQRKKESKNSLRNLISRMSSSKRFDVNTSPDDYHDTQF